MTIFHSNGTQRKDQHLGRLSQFYPRRDPLSSLGALILLGTFLSGFFYLSLIFPVIYDIWGFRVAHLQADSFFHIFRSYKEAYFTDNPRLGHFFMLISGHSAWSSAVVSTLGFVLLLHGGFVLALGRHPRPGSLRDVLSLFLMLAILIAGGTEIAFTMFYSPFSTNYVVAYAVLVQLIAFYRLHGSGTRARRPILSAFAMFVLGFLAGMTNEHTVPAYLLLICVWAAYKWLSGTSIKLSSWQVAGAAGLVGGYLALFFAPGQSVRYGIDKYTALSALPSNFFDKMGEVMGPFLHSAIIVMLLEAILLLFLFARSWLGENRKAAFDLLWALALFVVAFFMALTVMASPLTGQRLMFASYFNLAVVAVGLFSLWAPKPTVFRPVLAVTILYVFFYFASAYYWFGQYTDVLSAQEHYIESEKAAGESVIELTPFPQRLDSAHEFMRHEKQSNDPEHVLNRLRAIYYGVEGVYYRVK